MPKDYLPRNWEAFAAWMANFNAQLPGLAAKYGIDAAKVRLANFHEPLVFCTIEPLPRFLPHPHQRRCQLQQCPPSSRS